MRKLWEVLLAAQPEMGGGAGTRLLRPLVQARHVSAVTSTKRVAEGKRIIDFDAQGFMMARVRPAPLPPAKCLTPCCSNHEAQPCRWVGCRRSRACVFLRVHMHARNAEGLACGGNKRPVHMRQVPRTAALSAGHADRAGRRGGTRRARAPRRARPRWPRRWTSAWPSCRSWSPTCASAAQSDRQLQQHQRIAAVRLSHNVELFLKNAASLDNVTACRS